MENGVDPSRLRDVLAAAYSISEETNVPANDVHDLVAAVETGRVDPTEFDRRLAEALSTGLDAPLEPANLTPRLFEQLRPDELMRRAVARARMSTRRWTERQAHRALRKARRNLRSSWLPGVELSRTGRSVRDECWSSRCRSRQTG
jgi:hypothetical protein